MGWLQFTLRTSQTNVDAYSDCLTKAGAVAVTLESGENQAVLEPLPGTTPFWKQTSVVGLFEGGADQVAIKKFLKKHLGEEAILNLEIATLEEQNWSNAWIDQFHPMRFGKNLMICPSWCESPDPNAVNILLDPGLAFGTGTHATTRLCLEWLDAHPPQEALVVDYGCGSGILGIAALKLGASQVYAVDYDPQALESTKMNAAKNNLDKTKIIPVMPNVLKLPKKADLLLANILANPLIELAPLFASLIRQEGGIVLAGILENQWEEVFSHYQKWFNLLEVSKEEEWVRLSAIKCT